MLLQAAVAHCGYPRLPSSPHPIQNKRLQLKALNALSESIDIQVEDWAKEVIEKQLVDGALPDQAWINIWKRVFRNEAKVESYQEDDEIENGNIIRTKKTFAAVELVHFCAHAPAREKWKILNMGQSLGKTMFWHFIEPAIRSIRELVGCEYIYLFAADSERTGKLCELYQDLGFVFRDDLYLTKPAYDFTCFFMCQEVRRLRNRKKEFLKNYNKPKEQAQEPAAI